MRAWGALALTLVLTSSALADAPVPIQPARSPVPAPPARDPGAFARGAAIYGLVSSALLFGGAIAIAAVSDVDSERITRGVWFGVAAFSPPFVALGAWTARKRTGVEGYKALRVLGFAAYSGVVGNGILQWYLAFQRESQPWGLTVGLGALSVVATLPEALDAHVSGRRARGRRYGVSPGGFTLRF